jgi:hypothetical protein
MISARIPAMRQNQRMTDAMRAILNLLGTFVGNLFKSRRQLEIENLFLRHQLKDSPEACTTSPAAPWL